MVSALFAAALVWADRGPATTLAGLALLGFSLAPIFPMLIASTPARLGAAHATHAIGFQVSAACLGAAALPGAAGLIARWQGMEAIPALLVADALALILLHEGTNALADHPRGG
jgi:fucose permease